MPALALILLVVLLVWLFGGLAIHVASGLLWIVLIVLLVAVVLSFLNPYNW